MRASAACRDDRLILLDRSVREIEAESILLARHPFGERPRLGGGQLQCRGDRYVAAEQAALPRRTFVRRTVGAGERSEEHTSELQSLMRISYAVFCLKKKCMSQYIKNQSPITILSNNNRHH